MLSVMLDRIYDRMNMTCRMTIITFMRSPTPLVAATPGQAVGVQIITGFQTRTDEVRIYFSVCVCLPIFGTWSCISRLLAVDQTRHSGLVLSKYEVRSTNIGSKRIHRRTIELFA